MVRTRSYIKLLRKVPKCGSQAVITNKHVCRWVGGNACFAHKNISIIIEMEKSHCHQYTNEKFTINKNQFKEIQDTEKGYRLIITFFSSFP